MDLSVTSPLPLENLFPLNYQNRTTNVLTKCCKIFFIGLLLLFCQVQSLFLVWIGLSSHWKPLGTISKAHSRVSTWLPNILFKGINFSLNKNKTKKKKQNDKSRFEYLTKLGKLFSNKIQYIIWLLIHYCSLFKINIVKLVMFCMDYSWHLLTKVWKTKFCTIIVSIYRQKYYFCLYIFTIFSLWSLLFYFTVFSS